MGIDIYSFAEIYLDGEWQKVNDKIFPSYPDEKIIEPFDVRSYTYTFLQECSISLGRYTLPTDSSYLNQNSRMANHYKKSSEIEGFGAAWLTTEEIEREIDKKCWKSFAAKIYTLIFKEHIESRRELLEQTDFFENLDVLKSLGDSDKIRVVFYFL